MGRIGDTLREARESKNLTLRDAEEATKIRLKYLQDLENENFDSLPGRAYVIGFLKTYAKYLQIEDQALVEEYKATYRNDEYIQTQRHKSNNAKTREITLRPKKLQSILLVAGVILLLLGTNFLYSNMGGRNINEPSEPLEPEIVAEEPNLSEDEEYELPQEDMEPVEEESTANNFDKIQVSIKISSEEDSKCWVNIVSDSKTVFTGTMTAGEEKEFEAEDNLEVKLGNAGVAHIVANGEDLGVLGAKGAVVTKIFEKDAL